MVDGWANVLPLLSNRSQLFFSLGFPSPVSQSANKSDDCQKLLDYNECRYNRQVHRLLSRKELKEGGKMQVFDIEELVVWGEKVEGCPYFASRQLAESPTTDLIFCPYNYLLDPLIRSSMSIDLDNSIVI